MGAGRGNKIQRDNLSGEEEDGFTLAFTALLHHLKNVQPDLIDLIYLEFDL